VIFLDSDDYLGDFALDKIMNHLKTQMVDVVILKPFPLGNRAVFRGRLHSDDKVYYNAWSLLVNSGYGPASMQKVYKISYLRNNKIQFDETIYFGEDLVHLINVLVRRPSVSVYNDFDYYYFRASNGLTKREWKPEQFLIRYIKVVEILNSFRAGNKEFIDDLFIKWFNRIVRKDIVSIQKSKEMYMYIVNKIDLFSQYDINYCLPEVYNLFSAARGNASYNEFIEYFAKDKLGKIQNAEQYGVIQSETIRYICYKTSLVDAWINTGIESCKLNSLTDIQYEDGKLVINSAFPQKMEKILETQAYHLVSANGKIQIALKKITANIMEIELKDLVAKIPNDEEYIFMLIIKDADKAIRVNNTYMLNPNSHSKAGSVIVKFEQNGKYVGNVHITKYGNYNLAIKKSN